jgi:hypothetical protein
MHVRWERKNRAYTLSPVGSLGIKTRVVLCVVLGGDRKHSKQGLHKCRIMLISASTGSHLAPDDLWQSVMQSRVNGKLKWRGG